MFREAVLVRFRFAPTKPWSNPLVTSEKLLCNAHGNAYMYNMITYTSCRPEVMKN